MIIGTVVACERYYALRKEEYSLISSIIGARLEKNLTQAELAERIGTT